MPEYEVSDWYAKDSLCVRHDIRKREILAIDDGEMNI